MLQWNDNDSVKYLLNLGNFNKVACFDIDHTIIKPKNNRKFPRDKDDWEFYYNEITINKLNELSKDYNIIFFTNQSKLKNEFIEKIQDILNLLKLNISVFISYQKDNYRKPCLGMWNLLKDNLEDINLLESFYCGDAAGRPEIKKIRKKDFSDSDIAFAYNIGIKFYVPEQFFLKQEVIIPDKSNFDYNKYLTNKEIKLKASTKKEMIIMIGFPGCGKSYLSKQIGYEIINQDNLKNKKKCLKETEKLMKLDKSLIIDNTNYNVDKRKDYILLAKKYNYFIRSIVIDNSIEFCQHMNSFRSNYHKKKQIPIVVYRTINKYYEKPTKDEGIDKIEIITNKLKLNKDELKFYMYWY